MTGRVEDSIAPAQRHVGSYYAATVKGSVQTLGLDGSMACDVCIVGGGFTGLSAALHLARRGFRVVVLEQSLLGWGASGRNGGQIHVGQRRDQRWLERRVGNEAARSLWNISLNARRHLDWLIATYSIECDLRPGLLHADHRERYLKSTREYLDYLQRHYQYESARYVSGEEMRHLVDSQAYFGGSLDMLGGHLHTLDLALGIARAAQSHNAQLFEDAEVLAVQRNGTSGWHVKTARAVVAADQVLLACNGYLRGLSTQVQAHVMPINNFVAVTEPLKDAGNAPLIREGYAVSDSRFVVYYFRLTPDGRLLFGGGENYSYRFPSDISAYVHRHIVRIFPQLARTSIEYAWGGTLAITPTRMPYIRELSPGLYNASGYSGKGVLMAPYAGKMVADAMSGDRAEFQLMSELTVPRFPGGRALRTPTLIAAMSLAALADNL